MQPIERKRPRNLEIAKHDRKMKRNNDKIEETREICAAAENIDN